MPRSTMSWVESIGFSNAGKSNMVLKFSKKPCSKTPAKMNQIIKRKLTAEPLEKVCELLSCAGTGSLKYKFWDRKYKWNTF